MKESIRERLNSLHRAVERRMFLVVFAGVVLGWTCPRITVLKPLVPFLFGYMTFVTALGLSWRNVFQVAGAPGPIFLLLGIVHLVMPVLSLGLGGLAWGVGSPYATGLLLAACIPMAVTSVIWSGILGGETSLSLTAVAVDSLLSPIIVPGSIWVFLRQAVRMDVKSLFFGLVWMIVFPTILGLTWHDLSKGRAGTRWGGILGLSSKAMLTLVVATNLAVAKGAIPSFDLHVFSILLLLFVQTSLGFILGWAAARLLRYPDPRLLALTFGAGMRNISAGSALAVGYFPPAVGLPVILGFLFQQPTAALFAHLFTRAKAASSS